MATSLPKLISIVGPTASGKTSWGLRIAKDIEGEIISADSRQIYTYMDIGTAKEPGDWKWKYRGLRLPRRTYIIDTIPHYIIDFLDPTEAYSVSDFQTQAIACIYDIHARGKVPMLVGGTGLYVQSVIDNFVLTDIAPDLDLRAELEESETKALVARLSIVDPDAAGAIDVQNRRRLIRAIEVCEHSNVPFSKQQQQGPKLFDTLQIGIHVDRETLYTRINTRVDQMIADGLLDEIQMLLDRGYTWELSSMSSVGYRQFQPYFEKTATLESCIDDLKRDTRRFAKRQLTWFKRDNRIQWCSTYEEAAQLINHFLSR